jgi:hypothetical protein
MFGIQLRPQVAELINEIERGYKKKIREVEDINFGNNILDALALIW